MRQRWRASLQLLFTQHLKQKVVELMILHTCDKCIFSKSKWILSMDMVAAASKHLNINAEATMEEEVNLILETDDGTQFSKVKNLTRFDSSIVDIERQLLRQVSIFSQLLWRYGLMPGNEVKLIPTPSL